MTENGGATLSPPKPGQDANATSRWRAIFTDRQNMEINYCQLYYEQYQHGTDGHNIRMIVALMAQMLDRIDAEFAKIPAEEAQVA